MKSVVLDARLRAVAEMVGRCRQIADIGCDHGRLCAFLLQKGWIERAILTDISADSLNKAQRLIQLTGLRSQAEYQVCDGLEALPEAPDAVVIAGMGGDTVSGILERGLSKVFGARLVLQANVGKPALRRAVTRLGYAFTRERIALCNGRCYVIMEAVPGTQALTEEETLVGPILLREHPPELEALTRFHLRVARKALMGAQKGGDAAQAEALKREIAIWEALEA